MLGTDSLFEPPDDADRQEFFQARATKEGKKAADIAAMVLEDAGFEIVKTPVKIPKVGVQFNFLVDDAEGGRFYVDVSGAFTTVRPGLMRTDTLWKTLGRIHVLRATDEPQNPSRVLVLTSNLPKAGSEGDKALRAVGPDQVWDAIEMFDASGVARLRGLCRRWGGAADSRVLDRSRHRAVRGARVQQAEMMPTVAYAVVHTEPPSIFLSDDIEVLHRVLALEVVARTDPSLLGERAATIREAVLEERWGDATVEWIRATGTGIDVYDGKSVYTDDDLPADMIGAQLQFTRLFADGGA